MGMETLAPGLARRLHGATQVDPLLFRIQSMKILPFRLVLDEVTMKRSGLCSAMTWATALVKFLMDSQSWDFLIFHDHMQTLAA
jgi:hypothetical protein